jgi:hypothetical protein
MPRFLMPGRILEVISDGLDWKPINDPSWRSAFNDVFDFHGAQLVEAVAGTGAAVTAGTYLGTNAAQKPFGIRALSTGTDAAGGASVGSFTSHIAAGRGSAIFLARVAVETLASGAEDYKVRVGWHDASGAAPSVTDGVYWEYDRSAVAANWRICTAAAGTRTETNSGVAVSTDYIWLGIYINPVWARAEYFYSTDGAVWAFAGANITNIPSGTQAFGFGAQIVKTAGTGARVLDVDLIAIGMAEIRGTA